MSQVRSLWAVIMLSVEESLTAFSGVSPDLVGHSQASSKNGWKNSPTALARPDLDSTREFRR